MSIIGVRFGECGAGADASQPAGSPLGLPWSGWIQAAWRYSFDEPVAAGVSSDRLSESILDDHVVRGCALFERPVRTVGVVVLDVVAQEPLEFAAVPDEGAVEELPHGADPAFRISVGDWCVRRCANSRRAVAAEDLMECSDELAGAVADQEPNLALVVQQQVPGSLGGPGAGRIRRDAGEVHAAGVEFDEEQDVVARLKHPYGDPNREPACPDAPTPLTGPPKQTPMMLAADRMRFRHPQARTARQPFRERCILRISKDARDQRRGKRLLRLTHHDNVV